VVLKAGVNMIEFAVAANQAPPEYIPEARKDDMIAHTKLLGPDESETIEFTAPAAGSYDYLCTFPGHFAIMKGKMIVE
jgi:azurin